MGLLSNRIETTAEKVTKPKHRLSGQARFKMLVTGVVLPTLALLVSSGGALVAWPHWQSGEVDQYVATLLGWPGYGAFLPLILFSMTALIVWLWRDRMLQYFVVRLGLYTGVVLTIQFFVLLVLAEPKVLWMLLAAAATFGAGQAAVVFGVAYMIRNARRFSIRFLLIVTTVVAIAIALIKTYAGGNDIAEAGMGIPLAGGVGAPVLSLITMARAAICASKTGRSQWCKKSERLVWGVMLSWLGWLTCYFVAWRIAIDVMLQEYSQLPVTRPGCYVASAAAHGHPRWVRSKWVEGISMPVNNQLRHLKFLEITIKIAFPRLHCHVRIMYDCVGPRLAKFCRRSRWLSDAAFLLLMLPEAVAIAIRVLLRIPADRVNGLYR